MAWATAAEVKAGIADILNRNGGSLASYWDTVIPRAIETAKARIINSLMQRSFSRAAIESWVNSGTGQPYHLRYSMFYAFAYGVPYHNMPKESFEAWNVAPELKEVSLDDYSGQTQQTDSVEPSVEYGSIDVSGLKINMDTPL